MIVPRSIAHALVAGRATEVRLLAHRVESQGTCGAPWRVGESAPVRPSHRDPSVGRVVIESVALVPVTAATPDDARAEGWPGRHPLLALARSWIARVDGPWRAALPHATDEEVMERWRARHGQVLAWVMQCHPDPTARARLLAAHSEVGYTADPRLALPDEPEAVDAATQAAITAAAHRRAEADDATRRAGLARDLERQLAELSALRCRAHLLGPSSAEGIRRAQQQIRKALDDLRGDGRIGTRSTASARRQSVRAAEPPSWPVP